MERKHNIWKLICAEHGVNYEINDNKFYLIDSVSYLGDDGQWKNEPISVEITSSKLLSETLGY